MSVRKAIRVQVTETGIAKGVRRDSGACPVARAFRRANPRATWIAVDGNVIIWRNKDGQNFAIASPRSVQRFVRNFDSGKVVKPFSFRLLLRDVEKY